LTIGSRFLILKNLFLDYRYFNLLVGVEIDCPSTGVSDPLAVDVC
jgi:hypothetical protein